jgi:hypothetical protein
VASFYFERSTTPFVAARPERERSTIVTMILLSFRQRLLQRHLRPRRFWRYGHYQMYTPGVLR